MTQTQDERAAAIHALTDSLAAALLETQVDPRDLDAKRLIKSMLRVVPQSDGNALANKVGPFYDTTGLTSWLGVSRQALDNKVRTGRLLGCLTSERVRLYPTWQFTDEGELLPGLIDVLRTLRSGTEDGWTMALWLLTELEELDNMNAASWLGHRRDPDPVLELARFDAAAWAA